MPVTIDKRVVRLRFDRAAASYDRAAVLQHEVGQRLLERLDLVKLVPDRILDVGSGTGRLGSALIRRYPNAALVEVDLSLQMLRQGRPREGWWRRLVSTPRGAKRYRVCADMEQLPLEPNTVGLACSNLALAWSSRPQVVLGELRRVLTRGGLLMFTSLGPDTLKELRSTVDALGTPGPTHPFIDMHDLGDMLVASGFADPVMDVEHLTVTYADSAQLLAELRAVGGGSALASRKSGLRGRAWPARVSAGYERFRRDGRLPVTVEVIYGHAWKPEEAPRLLEDGRAIIRVERRSRSG